MTHDKIHCVTLVLGDGRRLTFVGPSPLAPDDRVTEVLAGPSFPMGEGECWAPLTPSRDSKTPI